MNRALRYARCCCESPSCQFSTSAPRASAAQSRPPSADSKTPADTPGCHARCRGCAAGPYGARSPDRRTRALRTLPAEVGWGSPSGWDPGAPPSGSRPVPHVPSAAVIPYPPLHGCDSRRVGLRYIRARQRERRRTIAKAADDVGEPGRGIDQQRPARSVFGHLTSVPNIAGKEDERSGARLPGAVPAVDGELAVDDERRSRLGRGGCTAVGRRPHRGGCAAVGRRPPGRGGRRCRPRRGCGPGVTLVRVKVPSHQ